MNMKNWFNFNKPEPEPEKKVRPEFYSFKIVEYRDRFEVQQYSPDHHYPSHFGMWLTVYSAATEEEARGFIVSERKQKEFKKSLLMLQQPLREITDV
jgi:hypothetical protein